jgi:hypothetical protein
LRPQASHGRYGNLAIGLVSSVQDRARTDAHELSASGPMNKRAYPNGQLRAGRSGLFAGVASFGATVLAAVPARETSLIPQP